MNQLRFYGLRLKNIILRHSLLTFFVLFAAFFLFTTKAYALFMTDPGGGSSSTSLEEYGRALSEPGVNLQQFALFNLDYTTWGMTKLLLGVPRTGGGGNIQGCTTSCVTTLSVNVPV